MLQYNISEILPENFKLFGAKLTEIWAFYVPAHSIPAASKCAASDGRETKDGRILRRQSQNDALDIASAAGTLFYGPGIDDSM